MRLIHLTSAGRFFVVPRTSAQSKQNSIAYADEQGANSSENPASRPVSMAGNGNSDSIMDWLLDLRLEALWPNFEAHG